MARISVSVFFPAVVAIFLFSLTFSDARIPAANVPLDEVNSGELLNSLPESANDDNSIIRLPSNSKDSESAPSDQPLNESSTSSDSSSDENTIAVESLPLQVVTFRPVDYRPRSSSRIRYRCPFNNKNFRDDDMILTNGEEPDQRMFQRQVHRVWPRLQRIHHHNHHGGQKLDGDAFPQLTFKPTIALDDHKFMYQKLQPRDHHRSYGIHEDGKEDERKEKHGDDFMKSIRKILNGF